MHAVECPLCNSGACAKLRNTSPLKADDAFVQSTFVAAGETVGFYVCRACTLVFRTPRPTSAQLARYYSEIMLQREPEIFARMGVTEGTIARRAKWRYSRIFAEVSRKTKRRFGHIVDLGGRDGASLVPWRERGWSTSVVDPSISGRHVDETGLHVASSLHELKGMTTSAPDIVTSYHCVEHIEDLAGWTVEARSLSSSNALWVIEVPFDVCQIPGLTGSQPFDHSLVNEEHLNFFTPKALRYLGRRLGLKQIVIKVVVTLYYFGPIVSLRLFGRAGSERSDDASPPVRSEFATRTWLNANMVLWRRLSGLHFRWFRALNPNV